MKRDLLATAWLFLVVTPALAQSPTPAPILDQELRDSYPHWPTDDESLKQLRTIEEFVRLHRGKGQAAVFDWDGTLYSEKIRVKNPPSALKSPEMLRAGQPVWHIWAASRLLEKDDRNLLPSFRTSESQEERARNILRRDDYLEGMFENDPDDVSKFLQIATFEAGMTPAALDEYLKSYAKTYDPCIFAIYPMLDVLHRLANNGFQVWIVSGSNPYLIATLVSHIERNCALDAKRRYDFHLTTKKPFDAGVDHILGNGAELTATGTFSQSFDDRALRVTDPKLDTGVHVMAHEGKELALRHWIEGRHAQPVVFVAGNSDGDDAMARFVLEKSTKGTDVMGMGVNSRKDKFPATLEKYRNLPHVRVVTITYDERSE